MRQVSYGFRKQLHGVGFDEARQRTIDALKSEGFGVLTEIDVKATMKAKLGVEFPAYTILGACNPSLAHRALAAEPEIGLLLPCNVVVTELDDGSEVQIVDPKAMFAVVGNPDVGPVADEVGAKLRRVLERI
jgi:uncharacterized protein (DUF302 family)